MTACDLDVVAQSTERGMRGDALRTWDNKFAGTGKSQTCKGKEEFKVTTAGAGKVLSWEVLKSCLRTTACLEAGFGYWYVGAVVTFTTLTGGTETVLAVRLDKTRFEHFTANINSIVTEMSHRNFTDCMIYRNMDTIIPSTKRRIKEHLQTTTGTVIMEDM